MTLHRTRRRRGLLLHAPLNASPLVSCGDVTPTFARTHDATHVATYVHPVTGLVTAASADELRIEANGALFEAARTNRNVYSQRMEVWNVIGTPTVVADDTTAPDGTQTADRLTLKAGDSIWNPNTVGNPGDRYEPSVYVKRVSVVGTLRLLNIYGPAGGHWAIDLSLLPDAWVRVTRTTPGVTIIAEFTHAGGGCGLQVLNDAGEPTLSVFAWGGQLEAGADASSYIPTVATAMSRNADALTLPALAGALTSIAKVDGTTQEIVYAGYDPTGHHVRDLLVWNRTFAAAEIVGLLLG